MIDFRKPLRIDSLANAPRDIRQLLHVPKFNWATVVMHEVKPTHAPSNVPRNFTDPRNFDRDVLLLAITWHVLHRNTAIVMKGCGDDTDGRFNPIRSGLGCAHV